MVVLPGLSSDTHWSPLPEKGSGDCQKSPQARDDVGKLGRALNALRNHRLPGRPPKRPQTRDRAPSLAQLRPNDETGGGYLAAGQAAQIFLDSA